METTQQSQEEVPKTKRRTKYRHKKLTVCARRLSRRHSCVLKRQLKRAEALKLNCQSDETKLQTDQSKCSITEVNSSTSNSCQMFSSASTVSDFPMCEYQENTEDLEIIKHTEGDVDITNFEIKEQYEFTGNSIHENIQVVAIVPLKNDESITNGKPKMSILNNEYESLNQERISLSQGTISLSQETIPWSQETTPWSQETTPWSQETMFSNLEANSSDTESDCELVVEKQKSVKLATSFSQGLDFADVVYVFNQLKKLGKHSKFDCGINYFKIIGVERCGLRKTYEILCRMCNYRSTVQCLQNNDDFMDINYSAVSATMVTGGGYSQLEQLMNGMNVECMSRSMYNKCHVKIIDAFQLAALREMEEAGKQEKQLAIERGDLCEGSNIPWIPVVADGSWMKRSYKGGYFNSLSGVGVIVGYHTKKVLYVGVKNKLCRICDIGKRRNKQPDPHRCFKNWGSNQSSTAMESFAIMEGFQSSVEQHGLVYSILIADGDSSVYKKILDCDPYKEYSVRVRKIECINHMLRNFSNKINQIVAEGGYRQLKTVVKASIFRLRAGIRQAAEYRFKEKLPLTERIEKLKVDLKNVPNHVFGEHKDCERLAYFCNKHSDPNVINYVPQLKEAGIYKRVEEAMQPLFNKIESLLYGINSNIVESFNSVIAKYIGGKRINYGSRGSYQGRVSAAVVQFNSKRVLSRLNQAMNKKSTAVLMDMENRRIRQQELMDKFGVRAKVHSQQKKQSDDKDYGPCADQPELEEIVFTPEYEKYMASFRKC